MANTEEGLYIVDLISNEKKINNENRSFSFSLKESIYSIVPKSSFTLFDSAGLLQEAYALIDGTRLTINFGNADSSNAIEYRITREEISDIKDFGVLSGDMNFSIEPSWKFRYGVRSKGYIGSFDRIFREVLSNYMLNLNIESNETMPEITVYQPLISDVEFMQKQLLPLCFSKASHNSPFYAFFTTDNSFNFKSLDTMFAQGSVASYTYKQMAITADTKDTADNTVYAIKRWKEDISYYLRDIRYSSFYIDRLTGNLIENKLSAYDHGLNLDNEYVPLEFTTNEIYGFQNLHFTHDTVVEGFNGVRNNRQKDSMIYDRFHILVSENPVLHAGKCIDLVIEVYADVAKKSSTVYSGKYLIEECEHIWNGEKRRGYTSMIVGRRFVPLSTQANSKVKLLFK